MSLNDCLREYWKTRGVSPNHGTTLSQITAFELVHNVIIPNDLREFLLRFNGTYDMSSEDYFRFLPLHEFASSETSWNQETGAVPPGISSSLPHGFFVFADLLQWCYGYAIQLGKGATENVVVLAGDVTAPLVANSFTEFMELYLSDSELLHPKAEK